MSKNFHTCCVRLQPHWRNGGQAQRATSRDSTEFEFSVMFAARGAGRYASGSPACAFFKKSVHSICSELLDRTVAAGPCAAVLTVARQHRSRAGHKVPLLLPARRRLTESAGTVRYAVECAVRWHSDKVKNIG